MTFHHMTIADSGEVFRCKLEESQGIVLACRVKPGSDLTLAVVGKMKDRVCA